MSDEVKIKIKRKARRRVCTFCADKVNVLDYKEINRHQRFISERGKIQPRRNTNLCAKHQRLLSSAIHRARYIGLIEFCID